jgi:hypothetical protein
MPLFTFTGGNDLDSWVNELNDHFSGNDFQEAQMILTAMQYLSADVQSAINGVRNALQQIIAQHHASDADANLDAFGMDGGEKGPGGEWSWSYSKLVRALRGMQSEDFSIMHTRETSI